MRRIISNGVFVEFALAAGIIVTAFTGLLIVRCLGMALLFLGALGLGLERNNTRVLSEKEVKPGSYFVWHEVAVVSPIEGGRVKEKEKIIIEKSALNTLGL